MINLTKKEFQYCYNLLNLIRKSAAQNPSFPVLIELQTMNRCNASCPACPYTNTIGKKAFKFISDKTYDNILDQLKQESDFQALVLTYQNEPLLDKRLVEMARKFKKVMPNKHLEIATNASLLTPKVATQLYKYFDLIDISVNAHSQKTYNSVMKGLDWDVLQQNLDFISKNKKFIDKTIIRFIKQKENINEQKEFKKYWNAKGFRVFGFDINDRNGTLENYDKLKISKTFLKETQLFVLKNITKIISSHCLIPSFSSYIRAEGDVVLCFTDYTDKYLMGNIHNNTIREIFNSAKYKNIRNQLQKNNISKETPCFNCKLYKDGIWLTI